MIDYDIHGEFACFYGGVFSQWYPSPINDLSVQFNCAEQAMMYRKAEFFKDYKSMEKIMLAEHPQDQKALGRKVKNFNVDTWNNVAEKIVYRNNILKFSQNKECQQVLFSTKNLLLVEASPVDVIWGIGRGLEFPELADMSKWRGKNLLGKVLTLVREALLIGDIL